MNDSTHPLRHKLADGGTIAGVWADIPHPQVTGAIAAAGFDFVILDCEHGGWDFAALEGGIAACETAGAAALVRTPGPDAFFAQRALDLGADGIVVPQVPDADAARRAVAMAHFAPDGARGYNPFTRGGRYGLPPQPKFARGYPFTGVLVESPAAAAHLDAIVQLPQLDLVYLGVYDYSVALGIPGQVDDPRVQAFVERAARLARDAGKAVGTTAMNAGQVARLTGWGVNVLLYGADAWLVAQGARAGLALYAAHARSTAPATVAASAPRAEAAPPAPAYAAQDLLAFAHALLARAGVRDDIARDVAAVLVDGDLLGHTTHGLAQLADYLAQLDKGAMRKEGAPIVVASHPATQVWDGQRLPGPWITLQALEAAAAMAAEHGTGTVVIRRSHHIACLAAYLKRATDRGLVVLLACSDPSGASVAPFGAVSPVFTPDPLAAGIPTDGDPILLDISASCTTNGLTLRAYKAGEKLPHAFMQDAHGRPTNDPAVLFEAPKGTLLPLGGLEAGHKGYALALLVEALTGGLAGHGRADPSEGWGATVFLQVLDPRAFGGRDALVRQTAWIAEACRTATPRPGGPAVRMPGERGLALMRRQQASGVALHPSILPALVPWAERYAVPVPAAVQPKTP